MTLTELFQPHVFLVLLAHPDDEVYCAAFLSRLIKKGKIVHVVYATSGDAKGMGKIREEEVKTSMNRLGISPPFIHMLQVPEQHILAHLKIIVNRVGAIIANHQVESLISHDYEGGHEAHDAISFCASELVKIHQLTDHIIYPLYHGKPQERQAAQFKPSRIIFLEMMLEPDEKKLKMDILDIHQSQKAHFEGLKRSTENYLALLQKREVYHMIQEPISYRKKPMEEVGYEYHRNGVTFDDFQAALDLYESE